MKRITRRNSLLLVLMLILSTVLFSATATPSLALTGSNFESGDGNLVVNGAPPAEDWANAPNLHVGIDLPPGQQDNSFGQGTKEDTAVPSVVNGSIPNNKSDLTRFYVANERNNGKEFLYFAWERVQEPSGTTNMDFEFNQSAITSTNGVTPIRTAGDVLIKFDLSQGGVNPVLGYHRWVTTGNPSQVCEASNSVPCWSRVQSLNGNFEASINTVPVVDPIPPDNPRTLSVRTFGEAAINLTDSGILPPGTCNGFGRAYVKSRSSDSFTAALKDFIAPIPVNISNCGTINVHKQDDAGNPLQGATFTLFTDNAPLGGNPPHGANDTATSFSCTTDASGDCTLGNTIEAGQYWVVETTTPPGYQTAPDQNVILTVGQTILVTFTDPRQFKIIVLVCQQSNNHLYSSTVTVDGVNKTSLPAGSVGESLCSATTGATYSDKLTGDHPANVNIPSSPIPTPTP